MISLKIELLDDKTVKVVLSNSDMMNFNLTYDEMDYKNPETKRVILTLVERIKKEVQIDISSGKLFIEAFPYADGGCILYVNLIDINNKSRPNAKRYKASFDTPIIYSFNDIDALGHMSKRMLQRYSHIILKNSLYHYKEKYFLFIYTYFKMDEQLSYILNEYGRYYGKGAISSAIIKEHAKEILANEALETLSLCL